MVAAFHLLRGGASVAVLEQGPNLGGNCFGVDVPARDGTRMRIDVGVSDFNIDTFTFTRRMFETLGLAWRAIGQDASFATRDGRCPLWSRDGALHHGDDVPDSLVADVARFARESVEVLSDSRFADWSVDRYLAHLGFGGYFARLYLRPRALGAFPMPDGDPGRGSIVGLVRFWKMHGLVGGRGTPRRMALEGGMHRYIDALRDRLVDAGAHLRCRSRVLGVRRTGQHVEVEVDGGMLRCRHVVFACPPGQLLRDPRAGETLALTQLPFARARVVVHRDPICMPADPQRWGAYNYVIEDGTGWPRVKPTITFSPRRIHPGSSLPEVFVTMNPAAEPRDILHEAVCTHPIVDVGGARLRARIEAMQGRRNTWYCGAWLRAPFLHEQAHATAHEVATRILGQPAAAA